MSDDRVFIKCAWRLIPFLALLAVVSYLDRLNVGFAALTMNKDLGFSPTVYGFGAGIFFAGYLTFQVPGNLVLARIGARRWFFCIMAAWGLLSSSNAFVQGPTSFYVLRFLLGVAEAGFFPGVLYFLNLWFPKKYRVQFAASFTSAIAVAGIIGGPLASFILANTDGMAGLHAWQWLFLIEGVPAILLAFVVLKFLPDEPGQSAWLNANEKAIIGARLRAEAFDGEQNLWPALRDPRVLALALAGFAHGAALFGTTLWLPQIVQAMGFSNFATGYVVAVPYVASAVVMIAWGRSSDRRDERIWHLALPWLLCALGLTLASLTQNYGLELVGLTLAVAGILSAICPLLTLPSSFLRGTAAAGATGFVNSIVSLGAVIGPAMIGMLKERTGGYSSSMAMIAIGLVLSALIVLRIGPAMAPRRTAIETAN